ncbi:hypothetical protein NDU88_001123, partial [Pleurodeles waltl]
MTDRKDLCSCIIWFLLLVFVAWPSSILMGAIYGCLSPFTTCFGLDDFNEFLLQGVNMAKICAIHVTDGKTRHVKKDQED